MADTGIIGKSTEASKGGFSGIIAVEGTLQPIIRVPSRFTENRFKPGEPNADQAQIELTDAVICEMEEGEAEPELKDGKFTTWQGYAPPSKPKPNPSTFFVKGFMKSAEALDAKRRGVKEEDGMMPNLYGTRVRLQKKEVFLFKQPKPGQEGVAKEDLEYDEKSKTDFVVVECGGDDSSPEDQDEYLRGKLNGLVKSAAKRAMLMDSKIKSRKDYKELVVALNEDTLADKLGMAVIGGKFAITEEEPGEELPEEKPAPKPVKKAAPAPAKPTKVVVSAPAKKGKGK